MCKNMPLLTAAIAVILIDCKPQPIAVLAVGLQRRAKTPAPRPRRRPRLPGDKCTCAAAITLA